MVRSRIVTNETSAPLIYPLLIYFFFLDLFDRCSPLLGSTCMNDEGT